MGFVRMETWAEVDRDGVTIRYYQDDGTFTEEFVSNRNLVNRNPYTGRFEKILYNEIYQ